MRPDAHASTQHTTVIRVVNFEFTASSGLCTVRDFLQKLTARVVKRIIRHVSILKINRQIGRSSSHYEYAFAFYATKIVWTQGLSPVE